MSDLTDLLFYKTGAMSFYDRPISSEALQEILSAATSCTWLGKWKMLAITDKKRRVEAIEAWQGALRKIGRQKDVEFIERWKIAPYSLHFVNPRP